MSVKKQVTNNLVVNILSFLVNILIGIWITPYLVHSLGKVAYGLVPLTLVINRYIGVATTALTSSFTRFYVIALQQGKTNEAKKYFNTSFFSILAFTIFFIPVIYFFTIKINSFITIPNGLLKEARLLFSLTLGSFFISIFTSLLNTSLYAKNRLDVMNGLKIFRVVIRAVIIVSSFYFFGISLTYVGVANILAELAVVVASSYYFNLLTPEINLQISFYDRTKLAAVLLMSFWVIMHQIGDVAIGSIDIYLLNRFKGVVVSGEVGAVSEWFGYVVGAVSLVSSLFGPLVLTAYAQGNNAQLIKICRFSLRFLTYLIAVIVGVLSGLSKPLLHIWLGSSFVHLSNIFIVKMLPLLFYLSVGDFFFVFRAWNHVKQPALFSWLLGVINVLVLLVLLKYFDIQPIVVVAICGLFLAIQSFGFAIVYFSRLYHMPVFLLLKDVAGPYAIYASTLLLSMLAAHLFAINNWLELIFTGGILGGLVGVMVLKYLLREDERAILKKFIPVSIGSRIGWLIK